MKQQTKKGTRTPLADPKSAQRKIRRWLLRTHPEEKELIGDFHRNVTFAEVNRRMHAGEDFGKICACCESVQRELVFTELARIYGNDYDYWFDLWLNGGDQTGIKRLMKELMKNPKIQLLTRSF